MAKFRVTALLTRQYADYAYFDYPLQACLVDVVICPVSEVPDIMITTQLRSPRFICSHRRIVKSDRKHHDPL
jgi:hypothetical protein